MRRSKGLASAIGVLSFAGACALPAPSRYEMTPSRAFQSMSRQERDSVVAQSIADREGPRVSVRADMTTMSGSRRVRAHFHVDDDAYVVIGHIGPDGVLRIVFPTDPHDDGFVKGGRSYQTPEFFAGFTDEYAYRIRTSSLFRQTSAEHDSYDGGLGYVFVIASWRPMHVDQFSTEGRWDTFELADIDYLRDPRPAVHELASLLVGDNPEAYTVKFASYMNTLATYAGSSFLNSAYGFAACNGFNTGFGYFDNLRPLGYYLMSLDYTSAYGYDPSLCGYQFYRGRYTQPIVQIAQNPGPVQPSKPRAFDPNEKHTRPEPRFPGGRMPLIKDGATDTGNGTQTSSEYRRRGLITDDGPSTPPARRHPGVVLDAPLGTTPARPSIQQMVERHASDSHEGWSGSNGWARAHGASGTGDGTMRQGANATPNPTVSRPGFNPRGNYDPGSTRGYSRPVDASGNSGARADSPRYSAPASSGGERSAPMSHPVSAPPVSASSPAPASPPPAASSSGDGGHPIKP